MKRNLIQVSVLAAAVLVINGCGGSDSSTTVPSASTGTAFYVDSAVEGCTVTCGSTVSTTDMNGQFTYEEGKECIFTIGDIELRRESGLYQGKVIVEDQLKTAQFLQSMDWDGNPNNGIQIDPRTADVMAQNDIHQVPNNDQDLADACAVMENANSDYKGGYIDQQDAQKHMDDTMEWYKDQYRDQYDRHYGDKEH